MKKLVELSNVNLNTSVDDVIQHLLQENKPVLISAPVSKNIWAVYERDIHKTHLIKYQTREHVIQRKVSRERFKRSELIKFASLVESVEYLRLSNDDLIKLIRSGIVNLRFVSELYLNTESLELELMSGEQYIEKYETPINAKDLRINSQSDFYDYNYNIKFFFTRKSFKFLSNTHFIVNELEDLPTKIDSVYVFERDILSFVNQDFEREIDTPDIPETSPYYIKDFLRNHSDLDQLSILGFRYYWGKTAKQPKAKGLVELIMNQLGYAKKKAEAAAFFLNPDPDGICGKTKSIADGCQFPYLTYCLERYWHGHEFYDKKITFEIQEFLEGSEGEGFSSDNAKYAELILRPSKFIRVRKKRI